MTRKIVKRSTFFRQISNFSLILLILNIFQVNTNHFLNNFLASWKLWLEMFLFFVWNSNNFFEQFQQQTTRNFNFHKFFFHQQIQKRETFARWKYFRRNWSFFINSKCQPKLLLLPRFMFLCNFSKTTLKAFFPSPSTSGGWTIINGNEIWY